MINARVKELRKKLKLSQKEFSKKLGIGLSTLAMIEVDKREVLERHINLICKIFNVNEDWLRYGTEPIFNKEKEDNNQEDVLTFLKKQGVKSNVLTLIETYLNMTEDGKELFDAYLDDFISKKNLNSENEKTSEELSVTLDNNTSFSNTIEIKLYDLPVSAGTGTYLFEDISYEMMSVDTRQYPNVDFALRVSGDSMEPRFFHNDIIYVKSTQHINNGQIGIFYYENEAYLKKFYTENDKIFLVSLNDKYKPIEIKNDTFKIVGVVL